jgi:uncharacterized membrane protein YagU involved in acid resistance
MRAGRRYWRATLIGGIGASFAMDATQAVFAAVFERGRNPDDRDEEVEGIAGLLHAFARFVPALANGRESEEAYAVHYVFGVGFAAAYVAGVRRAPWLAASGGTAFGAGLFLLSDRILIPMLKLGRPWARYSRTERTNAFFSHVAYGVVLDFARRRFAA